MYRDKEYHIEEMIGKQAFTSEDISFGEILAIIDQPDSNEDNLSIIGDVQDDRVQVIVKLNPKAFLNQKNVEKVLFSSETITEISDAGVKFNITREVMEKHLSM